MSKRTVEIDMDDYLDMLVDRRHEVEPRGWTVPDAVWDYAMETIEECGVSPEHSSPSYVVDNLAVNGDYGEVSNYNGLLDAISDTEQGNALFLYETQDGGSVISPEDAQTRYDDAKDEWLESAQLDEDADEDEEFEKTDEYKELCGEIGICYSL
jgi:hypothetical protein